MNQITILIVNIRNTFYNHQAGAAAYTYRGYQGGFFAFSTCGSEIQILYRHLQFFVGIL